MIKIKYISYGTGNRVGDTIYLNEDLKKYPTLHNAILEHEKKHTGRFSMFNFKMDFVNKDLAKVKNEWLSFIFKHPRAWLNFSPILRLEKEWCYDISLLILWTFMITLFTLLWYFT